MLASRSRSWKRLQISMGMLSRVSWALAQISCFILTARSCSDSFAELFVECFSLRAARARLYYEQIERVGHQVMQRDGRQVIKYNFRGHPRTVCHLRSFVPSTISELVNMSLSGVLLPVPSHKKAAISRSLSLTKTLQRFRRSGSEDVSESRFGSKNIFVESVSDPNSIFLTKCHQN